MCIKHTCDDLDFNRHFFPFAAQSNESENMSGDHKTVVKGNPSQYVKLNVGGSLYYTTIGTLTKNDNMLRAMFSGRMEVLTDSEGMGSFTSIRSVVYVYAYIYICHRSF